MTALKTLSLRIRGVKTELEEAGLETDGMAETTSQLQEKLKALTGGKVDIMVDANNFKNTTEILREMSKEWEHMTDVEQAAALELLGGKRQANTLAAIINNFDIVEDAIESSTNSQGSALEENAKVLESIEGRITLFNNSIERFWNNLLDSDVIKTFVNLGTTVVETASKFGELKSVVFAILTYFQMSKKYSLDFASMLGIQDGKEGNYKWTLGQKGLTGKIKGVFSKTDTTSSPGLDDTSIGVVNELQEKRNDLLTKQESIQQELNVANHEFIQASRQGYDASTIEAYGNNVANAKQELEAVNEQIHSIDLKLANTTNDASKEAFSLLGVAQKIQNVKLEMPDMSESDLARVMDDINIATQQGQGALLDYASTLGDGDIALQGYIASLNGGTASISGFNDYIKTHNAGVKASGVAAKAAAVGHQLLNAAIGMGISLLVSAAISAITKWINSQKELAESVKEVMTEYNNLTKTLRDHYDTIEEIQDDYQELADGVDNLGRNVSLSTDEYKRYNEITNKIAEMFPQMVSGYTEEGNAIISLKGDVEELTKAYENEAEAARDAILVKQNSIYKDFLNKTDSEFGGWTTWNDHAGYNDYIRFIEAYIEYQKGNTDQLMDIINNEEEFYQAALFQMKEDLGFDSLSLDWELDLTSLQSLLKQVQSEARAAAINVKSVLNAYLAQDFDYLKLSDEGKNMAQSIISGFDTEFYSQFNTAEEMEAWVVTNVIKPLQNSGNMAELNIALNLQTQFNNGDISVDDYMSQIEGIITTLEKLGFDEDVIKQIRVVFGVETENGTYDTLKNSAMEILDDDGDSKVGTLTKEDLEIIDKNKTAWKEEFGLDDNTLMSWDDLTAAIQKAKDKMEEASVTFQQLSEKIDGIQSVFDTLTSAQKEYRENGYFSVDTMQKLLELEPKYLDLLYDEKGNINLNKQALLDVAKARIIDLGIKQKSVIVEKALSLSQTGATNDLLEYIEVNEQAIKSNDDYVASTLKTIQANLERRKSEGKIDIDVDSFMSGLNSQLDAVDRTINGSLKDLRNAVSSSGNTAKEEALDKFQKAMKYYENRISANQARYEQIQNEIDLLEKQGKVAGEEYYQEQINLENERLELLVAQKAEAQKYLGKFKEGSDEWWEVANTLNDLESEIDSVSDSILDLNNAMAEVDWYVFDETHKRFGSLIDDLNTIRDLISPNGEEDWFEDGMWTDKGVASLATHIQQLQMYQNALDDTNKKLEEYNKPYAGNEEYYKALGIDSEQELFDKREELINQQYDYKTAINDTQQSVVDMYEAQIGAVEEWADKAIDAYNDYIDVVKEALDAERDLHDFKKSIEEDTTNIAELERKIASLSGSTDAADIAQIRKLQAELNKAKSDLDDKYYDHAKDAQSDALDSEADAYEKSMKHFVSNLRTSLDTALQDMDKFMKGVTAAVINNAPAIKEQYNNLGLSLDEAIIDPWTEAADAMADYETNGLGIMNGWITEGGAIYDFSINANDLLQTPWQDGETAITSFENSVKTAMSNVVTDVTSNVANASAQLSALYDQIVETQRKINNVTISSGGTTTAQQKEEARVAVQNYIDSHGMLEGDKNRWGQDSAFLKLYQAYTALGGQLSDLKGKTETVKGNKILKVIGSTDKQIGVGSEAFVKSNTKTIGKIDYYHNTSEDVYYRLDELKKSNSSRNPGYYIPKGTKKYKYYAKGTLGTKRDEWAITDESWIGEEITLAAGRNGQLQYLKKGSAVMPSDISANLVEWGKLDPNMMNLTNPTANINMINNAVNKPELNLTFDSLVHVDHCDEGTLKNLEKMVDTKINDFSKQLNYSIKKFAR